MQHWIINVYRAYSAFMLFPEGPVAFYNTLSLSSYTARNTVYCMLTVLADGFAVSGCIRLYVLSTTKLRLSYIRQVYRAYVVWQRKWWITIVPAILLVGTLGTYFFDNSVRLNAIYTGSHWHWRDLHIYTGDSRQ